MSDQWQRALRWQGYEHHVSSITVHRLSHWSRLWCRIFRELSWDRGVVGKSVFEVGCGGGIQMAQFVFHGWRCVGIDVSSEALGRAQNFIREIERWEHQKFYVRFAEADIQYVRPDAFGQFDLVFYVGVLEHFLKETDRLDFIRRMLLFCKPGGYLISVVPSGNHPWRSVMKEKGLGGYSVPEIDYNEVIMKKRVQAVRCENRRDFTP